MENINSSSSINQPSSQSPLNPPPTSASPNIFLIVLAFIGMVVTGLGGYFLGKKTADLPQPTFVTMVEPSPSATTNMVTDKKTYTSTIEKVTFEYPSNWNTITPPLESNIETADQISLQSPSGKIQINWVSAVDGFGGGCDLSTPVENGGCPHFTLLEKSPIAGAPSLYVVSGIVTRDGKTYEPWMGVQDSSEGALTSTKRTMAYGLFTGKNNGQTTAIFSTSTAYAGGPKLTKTEAEKYFDNPEVQQAKDILLSLKY